MGHAEADQLRVVEPTVGFVRGSAGMLREGGEPEARLLQPEPAVPGQDVPGPETEGQGQAVVPEGVRGGGSQRRRSRLPRGGRRSTQEALN